MSLEALHRRECARISRLANIFIDRLTLGDKVFVVAGSEITETAVRPLVNAIRAYGAAPLLFVTSDDSRSRIGTVEVVDDGLLHGHVERFSDPANMPATTDTDAWLAVCQAAIRALQDTDAPHPGLAAIEIRSGDDAPTVDDGDSWEVEALAMARQAVALCPADPENHAHIGWLLEKKGDLDAAARELRIALRLRPEERRYDRALEDIELRKRHAELTALLDEAILHTVRIALQDRTLARRVLAGLFPALYYFTPWVKVCRSFAHTASPQPAASEAMLREALLPLLELCVVDEEFYASQNLDLKTAYENGSLDLSEHWRTHGYFEGRACCRDDLK
jgi:tetratricopeptide (TPR) repeat protein